MKIIEVEGSHYEMGYQQGKELKEKIQIFTKAAINYNSIVGEDFLSNIRKNLKKYPQQMERLEGIADGSESEKNLILAIHFAEILSGDMKSFLDLKGCTSILVKPEITETNEVLAGKNYDFPHFLRDFQILRISRPKNRYASICLTQNAIVGNHNGMNEHGLIILYTIAFPAKDFSLDGTPITILIEETLETCRTSDEAVSFLKTTLRGNGAILGIIDKEANIFILETSRNHFVKRKLKEDFAIHTNKYLTEEMIEIDTPSKAVYKNIPGMEDIRLHESSERRYSRARDLILSEEIINQNTLKRIFNDHGEDNLPSDNTICRHGIFWETLGSIIFNPHQKKVFCLIGNPCQGEYQEIDCLYFLDKI